MRLPISPLLVPALLALGFVGCSCQRDSDRGSDAAPADAAAVATDAPVAPDPAEAQRAARLQQQRERAFTDAVSTLHGYLQRVGSGDQAGADKFWGYQRKPAGGEESDLRALRNLRGLRIENKVPEPLDQEPVPELLRIPVELRATLANGESRRYKGWYRLRRNQVEQRWELTGALVAVTLQ